MIKEKTFSRIGILSVVAILLFVLQRWVQSLATDTRTITQSFEVEERATSDDSMEREEASHESASSTKRRVNNYNASFWSMLDAERTVEAQLSQGRKLVELFYTVSPEHVVKADDFLPFVEEGLAPQLALLRDEWLKFHVMKRPKFINSNLKKVDPLTIRFVVMGETTQPSYVEASRRGDGQPVFESETITYELMWNDSLTKIRSLAEIKE